MNMRRERAMAAALLVAAAFFLQGCATLGRGPSQKIPVTSFPAGARVLVDSRDVGTAPLTLDLKRQRPRVIRIEKEGYNPREIRIKRNKPSALFWGGPLSYGFCGGVFLAHVLPWMVPDFPDKIGFRGTILGWYLLGGLTGAAAASLIPLTDLATGAAYSLSPKSLDVFLMPDRGQPRLDVTTIDEARLRDVHWLRIRAVPDAPPFRPPEP